MLLDKNIHIIVLNQRNKWAVPALKRRLEMHGGDRKKLRKKVEDEQAAVRRRVKEKSHKGNEGRRDESRGRRVWAEKEETKRHYEKTTSASLRIFSCVTENCKILTWSVKRPQSETVMTRLNPTNTPGKQRAHFTEHTVRYGIWYGLWDTVQSDAGYFSTCSTNIQYMLFFSVDKSLHTLQKKKPLFKSTSPSVWVSTLQFSLDHVAFSCFIFQYISKIIILRSHMAIKLWICGHTASFFLMYYSIVIFICSVMFVLNYFLDLKGEMCHKSFTTSEEKIFVWVLIERCSVQQ